MHMILPNFKRVFLVQKKYQCVIHSLLLISLKILMVFSYFNRGDLLSKYIIMQMNSVQ